MKDYKKYKEVLNKIPKEALIQNVIEREGKGNKSTPQIKRGWLLAFIFSWLMYLGIYLIPYFGGKGYISAPPDSQFLGIWVFIPLLFGSICMFIALKGNLIIRFGRYILLTLIFPIIAFTVLYMTLPISYVNRTEDMGVLIFIVFLESIILFLGFIIGKAVFRVSRGHDIGFDFIRTSLVFNIPEGVKEDSFKRIFLNRIEQDIKCESNGYVTQEGNLVTFNLKKQYCISIVFLKKKILIGSYRFIGDIYVDDKAREILDDILAIAKTEFNLEKIKLNDEERRKANKYIFNEFYELSTPEGLFKKHWVLCVGFLLILIISVVSISLGVNQNNVIDFLKEFYTNNQVLVSSIVGGLIVAAVTLLDRHFKKE